MSLFRKKQDGTATDGVENRNDSTHAEKNEKEASKSGYRRSSFYNKYFRGYTEIRQLNAKGRVVIERVYTQPWIVSGLSKVKYWLLRLLYAVLAGLSTTLFIAALVQKIPGNYTWMVALPGYASALLLFMLLVATLSYIFVERKMTLWGYENSVKKLKRYSLATAIGQFLTSIAMAAVALTTQLAVSESLKWAGAILISAVCSGAMYLIERKVPYKEVANDNKLPNGEAHEIW